MYAKDLWKDSGYRCTDPDNLQFSKQVQSGWYTFLEFDRFMYPEYFREITDGLINEQIDRNPKFWIAHDVILKDYTVDEITNHLAAYGYVFGKRGWIDCNGHELESLIIAECIFEQESGLY